MAGSTPRALQRGFPTLTATMVEQRARNAGAAVPSGSGAGEAAGIVRPPAGEAAGRHPQNAINIDAPQRKPPTSSPRAARRRAPGARPKASDVRVPVGSRATVLVIDGDDRGRRAVIEMLAQEGHASIEASDGTTGLRVFYERRPDLVVFDLALPELGGWQLLARIRELSDVPIMIVRSRGRSDLERVRALRSGADDVLDKPVQAEEFLARVERLLRRVRAQDATAVYDDGFLQIDFPRRAVAVAGNPVQLSPQEYRLLVAFVRHPAEVLDRDRLRELVWGGVRGVPSSRVKLYVSYLRRKLGERPDGASPIQTVRGFGYMYRAAVDDGAGRVRAT